MDELDQLIEGALDFEGDSEEPADTEETPIESDATDDVAEAEVADSDDSGDDSEGEDPQDDSLPDEDLDGTEEDPEESDPNPGPDPQLTALELKVRQQQEFIRSVIEEAKSEQQRQEEAQRKQEEEQEYQRLLSDWEQMDPDQARREQVAYLAEQSEKRDKALRSEIERLRGEASAKEQQQAQEAYLAAEEVNKELTIQHIANKFKLNDHDKWTMSAFSTPQQMEEYAERVKALRREQTSAARKAKRQELESNPALKVTEGGNSARAEKKEFENVDELIDSLW